jgi:hypothetical protein
MKCCPIILAALIIARDLLRNVLVRLWSCWKLTNSKLQVEPGFENLEEIMGLALIVRFSGELKGASSYICKG